MIHTSQQNAKIWYTLISIMFRVLEYFDPIQIFVQVFVSKLLFWHIFFTLICLTI